LIDRRIEFRIGIHLGDVVQETDGDLMGDGVNIAARLEGICEPGQICLSEQAYWQVKSRLNIAVNDRGAVQRVYSLQVGVLGVARTAEPAAPEKPSSQLALPDKPSIAVLAFHNMSGDPEQEYFADGMVEDIVTGLSRIKWLFVIARNSSFVYKGKAVDVRQVGRELGVRYVLEGGVRKAGNRLRITAQLLEAETGAHLWADRYHAYRRASDDCRRALRAQIRRRASCACALGVLVPWICVQGPWSWQEPTLPQHNSARPSGNRREGPIFPGIGRASAYDGSTDDVSPI
jgi:TolB-like protein